MSENDRRVRGGAGRWVGVKRWWKESRELRRGRNEAQHLSGKLHVNGNFCLSEKNEQMVGKRSYERITAELFNTHSCFTPECIALWALSPLTVRFEAVPLGKMNRSASCAPLFFCCRFIICDTRRWRAPSVGCWCVLCVRVQKGRGDEDSNSAFICISKNITGSVTVE